MRKLILQSQLSLDGFMADEDGRSDWMIWSWGEEWTWDKELQKHFIETTGKVDTILVSRMMAEEGYFAHWENVAARADDPQAGFARRVVDMPKIVCSTTLKTSAAKDNGWKNAIIANDVVKTIRELKAKEGKDIVVYGGAKLANFLIEQELIDEYSLLINPVVLAKGVSFFSRKMPLHIVNTRLYECGVLLLEAKPVKFPL